LKERTSKRKVELKKKEKKKRKNNYKELEKKFLE
jgi:hypothetical protein